MACECSKKDSDIPIGGIVAVIISYCLNKSILWAVIHFFFGWWYIAYVVLRWLC